MYRLYGMKIQCQPACTILFVCNKASSYALPAFQCCMDAAATMRSWEWVRCMSKES